MRMPRDVIAAVKIAKSKIRKWFSVENLDTYTIAMLKYEADRCGMTIAELISELVCDRANDYMILDVVEDWLPATVRAEARRIGRALGGGVAGRSKAASERALR
ncbi:MAG: hypothetical protein WCG92_18230 [Hyphomicrobiales bacterium]